MASIETAAPRGAATFADLVASVVANVERVIQGKREVIELVLLCLVSEGHLLLEDVPGVGKTSLAKALATSIDCSFGRVQFTPDLLPSDVVGVTVWNRGDDTFDFRPGPVFANIVLADEINRASPKTQSALLEAMAEGQVTVDGVTYPLDAAVHGDRHAEPDRARGHLPAAREPARPLPHAGVGRLPVAARRARDPRRATATTTRSATSAPVVSTADIEVHGRRPPARSTWRPASRRYLVDLANATRRSTHLALGMSPRATLALQRVAKAAGRGRRAAPTSSPTTSRPWPCPCSPTACS